MTRRLILSYLTVTMFVLIVLEVPFAGLVADRQRRELVTGLERDALVLATIYENWGRPDERATRRILTLAYGKEMHDIARLTR